MTEQQACDISFYERVKIYSFDYLKCCIYINTQDNPQHVFTKKTYSKLISSSHLLEEFLDFNGAKNNKDWFFYRELSAVVRHLGLAGNSQKHLNNRLAFYDLPKDDTFIKAGEKTHDFIMMTIISTAKEVLKEAKRLDIIVPKEGYNQDFFPGVITSKMLEFDIDDEEKDQDRQRIVKIASEYMTISKNFDQFGFYEPYSKKKLKELVPEKVNEVEIRQFEMVIHNLQSSFDTYVIYGGFRYGNRKLKQLRGFISVVLHLLQMAGSLLHFYERHLLGRGYKTVYQKVRKKLTNIVDPIWLLDRIINYGLYYVCHFLDTGKTLAQEIINENIERSSITVSIPEKLGFHNRPSTLVAKIVQHYGGEVELCIGEDRFDASSVLDLTWAGGKILKEKIKKVTFEGDVRSLEDIKILANVNYGEDTMGKGIPLPKELNYLK